MKNIYGYIYLTLNSANNKMYIGKRKSRNLNDSYLGSGKILKQAFNKYGIENFRKEILAIAFSEEELCRLEKHYIEVFGAIENEKYYNLAEGGTGGHTIAGYTKEQKEEYKRKMSNSLKGRVSPTLGMKLPDSHKMRISKANKGRVVSDETKRKIGKFQKGRKKSKEEIENIKLGLKKYYSLQENRKKNSDRVKNAYENNPELRRKVSERTKEAMSNPLIRKKISEACKGRISPNKGKNLSNEHCEKLSESAKKRKIECLCKFCGNHFYSVVCNSKTCEDCRNKQLKEKENKRKTNCIICNSEFVKKSWNQSKCTECKEKK